MKCAFIVWSSPPAEFRDVGFNPLSLMLGFAIPDEPDIAAISEAVKAVYNGYNAPHLTPVFSDSINGVVVSAGPMTEAQAHKAMSMSILRHRRSPIISLDLVDGEMAEDAAHDPAR